MPADTAGRSPLRFSTASVDPGAMPRVRAERLSYAGLLDRLAAFFLAAGQAAPVAQPGGRLALRQTRFDISEFDVDYYVNLKRRGALSRRRDDAQREGRPLCF